MVQPGGKALVAAPFPAGMRAPRLPLARVLINVGHLWVLHRPLLVRLFAAALATATLGGLIAARGSILEGVSAVGGMAESRLAGAGFAITAIEITGQTLSAEADIVALLGIGPGSSTLALDVEAARKRLFWLRAVESADVRKVYPGRLIVTLTERTPVARWRSGGLTYLIDSEGRPIGEEQGAFAELPLVVGEGAADDALGMIRALARFDGLKRELMALSRIGDRRWDMLYRSGLKVRLPEFGVAQALERLDAYQRDYALLDRDVTAIDLRVPGVVTLTPTIREDDEAKD